MSTSPTATNFGVASNASVDWNYLEKKLVSCDNTMKKIKHSALTVNSNTSVKTQQHSPPSDNLRFGEFSAPVFIKPSPSTSGQPETKKPTTVAPQPRRTSQVLVASPIKSSSLHIREVKVKKGVLEMKRLEESPLRSPPLISSSFVEDEDDEWVTLDAHKIEGNSMKTFNAMFMSQQHSSHIPKGSPSQKNRSSPPLPHESLPPQRHRKKSIVTVTQHGTSSYQGRPLRNPALVPPGQYIQAQMRALQYSVENGFDYHHLFEEHTALVKVEMREERKKTIENSRKIDFVSENAECVKGLGAGDYLQSAQLYNRNVSQREKATESAEERFEWFHSRMELRKQLMDVAKKDANEGDANRLIQRQWLTHSANALRMNVLVEALQAHQLSTRSNAVDLLKRERESRASRIRQKSMAPVLEIQDLARRWQTARFYLRNYVIRFVNRKYASPIALVARFLLQYRRMVQLTTAIPIFRKQVVVVQRYVRKFLGMMAARRVLLQMQWIRTECEILRLDPLHTVFAYLSVNTQRGKGNPKRPKVQILPSLVSSPSKTGADIALTSSLSTASSTASTDCYIKELKYVLPAGTPFPDRFRACRSEASALLRRYVHDAIAFDRNMKFYRKEIAKYEAENLSSVGVKSPQKPVLPCIRLLMPKDDLTVHVRVGLKTGAENATLQLLEARQQQHDNAATSKTTTGSHSSPLISDDEVAQGISHHPQQKLILSPHKPPGDSSSQHPVAASVDTLPFKDVTSSILTVPSHKGTVNLGKGTGRDMTAWGPAWPKKEVPDRRKKPSSPVQVQKQSSPSRRQSVANLFEEDPLEELIQKRRESLFQHLSPTRGTETKTEVVRSPLRKRKVSASSPTQQNRNCSSLNPFPPRTRVAAQRKEVVPRRGPFKPPTFMRSMGDSAAAAGHVFPQSARRFEDECEEEGDVITILSKQHEAGMRRDGRRQQARLR